MTVFEKAIMIAVFIGFVFLGFVYYNCDSGKKEPCLPSHSTLKIFNLR